jgi:L-seryl-tRNA(Ser) seleniumtransferase
VGTSWVIAGSAELVKQIERHPLARAFRADKTTLAGIAATLRHYARGEAVEKVPVWQMISATVETLRKRASSLQSALQAVGTHIDVVETESTVGGGSLPGQRQPSIALALSAHTRSVDALAKALRTGTPRVFGRIESERLLLDLRTVLPEQDDALAAALLTVFGADESRSA